MLPSEPEIQSHTFGSKNEKSEVAAGVHGADMKRGVPVWPRIAQGRRGYP